MCKNSGFGNIRRDPPRVIARRIQPIGSRICSPESSVSSSNFLRSESNRGGNSPVKHA